jgi:hypothetical protein
VLLFSILVVALAFAIAGLLGAPYVPILRRDSQALLKLANLQPGQTLVDLGSGDGRLLRAAAAQGIRGIGYEINPFMVLTSRLVCWRYRRLITIHWANLWHTKLPPADVIYVFLMPRFMTRLNDKLTTELTQPTRVISFAFEMPGRTPTQRNTNTFVYEYGQPAN